MNINTLRYIRSDLITPEELDEFAKLDDRGALYAVISNPQTSSEALYILMRKGWTKQVAKHPNLSQTDIEEIIDLAKDEETHVEGIFDNEGLTNEQRIRYLKNVIEMSTSEKSKYYYGNFWEYKLLDHWTPVELLPEIQKLCHESMWNRKDLSAAVIEKEYWENPDVDIDEVLNHNNTPPNVLVDIYNNKKDAFKPHEIITNVNTPIEIIEEIASSKVLDIDCFIINIRLSKEVIEKIISELPEGHGYHGLSYEEAFKYAESGEGFVGKEYYNINRRRLENFVYYAVRSVHLTKDDLRDIFNKLAIIDYGKNRLIDSLFQNSDDTVVLNGKNLYNYRTGSLNALLVAYEMGLIREIDLKEHPNYTL
jgi:hypothetical protein